ncbi:MAG: hypothetical protein EBR82_83785 [Caulobacteraceae bacterium]|nr:hypothetical protein [Caulobacteraceae bacterium]
MLNIQNFGQLFVDYFNKIVAAASARTPPSGYGYLFFDSGDSNKLKKKIGGTVTAIEGAGGGGALAVVSINSSADGTTLAANTSYHVDVWEGGSGSAFAVVLPVGSDGDIVEIIDVAGHFNDNNLTMNPQSGDNIDDLSSKVLGTPFAIYRFVYDEAQLRWVVSEKGVAIISDNTPVVSANFINRNLYYPNGNPAVTWNENGSVYILLSGISVTPSLLTITDEGLLNPLTQGSSITNVPTDGSATAADNATAINSILAALRAANLIAT